MRILLLIPICFLSLIVLFLLILTVQTVVNQNPHNSSLQTFTSGKIPNPPMNGFYNGYARFFTASWKGKEFNFKDNTGVNIIGNSKLYPFKTYIGTGLRDKSTKVLKLDYDIPQNSFLIRTILDELVEVKPGQYIGKVYIRIFPSFPFSVAYFRLSTH